MPLSRSDSCGRTFNRDLMMRTITDLRLEELTSRNPVMRRCLHLASFAAKSDAPVLILGRTGTGKPCWRMLFTILRRERTDLLFPSTHPL